MENKTRNWGNHRQDAYSCCDQFQHRLLGAWRIYHAVWTCVVLVQREILPLRGLYVLPIRPSLRIAADIWYIVISLLAGVTFSPHATNFVKPLEYTGSQANLNAVTLYFSRLVLGVQLVLAGVQLPSRYLKKEWKSLALLLGPIMTIMWIVSSLIVWAMVPHLPVLHALAIGACVTPTDPVLSNSIVKGKFADKNVPKDLQKIIVAESGANDGLG